MNAYQTAQQIGLTGTDTEIVSTLQSLAARDVQSADVAAWMRENGLWMITPDGQFGTLHKLYLQTTNPVKAGLSEWYASVFGGGAQSIRVTRPDIAARVAGVISLIAAALPDGDKICESFYALCGGRPWAELTVEQFAAQRLAAAAQAEREAAYAAVAARVNAVMAATATAMDACKTHAEITAAAEAAWGA